MKTYTRKTYKIKAYKRLLLTLLAMLAMVGSSVAQKVVDQHYYLTYPYEDDGYSISGVSIIHKPAKWYQSDIEGQRSPDDNFDISNSMVTLENGVQIQATNTYVDTIYMRKGTKITLLIPNMPDDTYSKSSINNYYRWFNYRNDKSFYNGDYSINGWNHNLLDGGNNYAPAAWRFENGYVAGLLNSSSTSMDGSGVDETNTAYKNRALRMQIFYYPTDSEFNTYKNGTAASNFIGQDNTYYAIACDLSNYTDFSDGTYEPGQSSEFGDGGVFCEPTLSGRVIFYIIGIDDDSTDVPTDLPKQFQHYWTMLNNSDYQGGGNEDGKKYLEEYKITYPSQRVSGNSSNDNEGLILSKEAQGYAIPGESGDETLDVQFASGEDNGLTLTEPTRALSGSSISLSGTSRVIQFFKGTTGTQWNVDDGSSATILVTKTVNGTTYNIARYKLTFKKESIPLTEAQVAALDKEEALGETTWNAMWWNDMTERAASHLESCDLVASLDFDYEGSGYGDSDKNSSTIFGTNYAERFNYPFPIDWSSNGYAFYDGSFDVNPFTDTTVSLLGSYSYHTQRMLYSTYGIVNYYVGNVENSSDPWEPTCKEVKNHDGNWLYINPTDRPATIAELSFDKGELAMGSKLLVSAWMRNANQIRMYYDASVLFTLIGVKSDGTEEPIYMSNSGQIEMTDGWVVISDLGEGNLSSSVTGKGSGTNEWYQMFFSYMLKEEDINDYAYYKIRVNNNCSQWQYGGFYFDELKVYKQDPEFEADVTQIEGVRTGSDTPMRLDIDYEQLMSCMGLSSSDYSSGSTDTQSLDFILINKDKYDESIEGGVTTANALKSSIVNISYVKEEEGTKSVVTTQNPGVDFYCNYDSNGEYDTDEAGYNFPIEGKLLRYANEAGTSMLSADFNADVSADSTYLVIINLSSDDDGSVNAGTITDSKLAVFAELVETQYVAERKFDAVTEGETRGGYQTSYSGDLVTETEVTHKAGRWYQEGIISQRASDDSFDATNSMVTLANDTEVQATHTYVDTIYLKKGTSIDLVIPNVDSDDAANASMNNYYRWFNYLNDKNYYVGNGIYGKDAANYDLLTRCSDSYTAWAFGNGYVSGLLNTSSTNTTGYGETNTLRKVTFYYPTDDEYITYIKSRNLENFDGQDNSYYAVACDLSNYTDFATTYTSGTSSAFSAGNEYCEPTLQERALFYIVGVDDESTDVPEGLPEQFQHYWTMLNDGSYQGGTDADEKNYLEEYEITFPSQRVSGNTNDNEVVTLSKEAQAYGVPGESGTGYLKVEFASGEANGLTLAESTLSGTERVIQFYNGTSGSQWSVDDGSKATILVTKESGGTTYNIARYKLTFKKESIPLTEAQVAALDKKEDLGTETWNKMWWKDQSERAPSYLNDCELLASLDFDYDGSGYGDSNLNSSKVYGAGNGELFNYPFPLGWSSNGYAFYDGTLDVNPLSESTESPLDGYTYHTGSMSWNTYGIVNYYVGNLSMKGSISQWASVYQSVKKHDGNWLYINATEKPAAIAELSFDKGELAMGSKLLVSAWMRNANACRTYYDASVLFTLVGVKADGTEETIHRSNSGQIEITDGSVSLESESGLEESVIGKGLGTNEWYQVFFTYELKEEDIESYDKFTIRVNNSCSRAQGGGYYFDELKVYKSNPLFEAIITPIDSVRAGSDTPMRLDINYKSLMNCLGLDTYDYTSESTETHSLDFILINKDKYEEETENGVTATEAIRSSIVDISYVEDSAIATASTTSVASSSKSVVTTQNPGVEFYCYYDKNEAYEADTEGYNFPVEGMLLTRTSESGTSMLSADFNAKVSADSTYLLLVNLSTPDDDSSVNSGTITDSKLAVFAELVETQYTAETEFETKSSQAATRGGYQTSYSGNEITEATVKHKAGRWYQANIVNRRSSEDTFDTTNSMVTLANDTEVQATHTYADTIYLKKGTSIDLVIPNVDSDDAANASMNNYYRWFNYLNDKNYYVGNGFNDDDLLTRCSDSYTAWVFGNGYVSGLLNTSSTNTTGNSEAENTNTLRKVTFYYPTDDEYITYIKSRNLENFDGQDNSYYAVACDLSNYTDFATTYTAGTSSAFSAGNEYCEPTLQERALFYIVGVDDESTDVPEDLPEQFQHYWTMLNDESYQGGGNGTSKKYLEEYEITFPSQQVTGNPNDNETLMLSKEAQAYSIPGQTGEESLNVQFASDDNDNEFTLLGNYSGILYLSGKGRTIQFYKDTSYSQWTVDDGSSATILVTKDVDGTTYNIARYKLTFKREGIPLTEAQVAALDEQVGTDTWDSMWWNDLGERGAAYLSKCDSIASLDFDYTNSGYGNSNLNSMTVYGANNGERFNYPFPMEWGNSGFAFYDGSLDVNPYNSSTVNPLDGSDYTYHLGQTMWNKYGIVNYYVGNLENKDNISPWEPTYKKVKNHDGNWLYINPTGIPATIAELPFKKDGLNEGTELFVTAWMRNANHCRTDYDASVLFTLLGVKADGTEVPLYMANSGQVESTNGWVGIGDLGENDLSGAITGKGEGYTNEWYQVFFTYQLKGGETDQYDHFAIKVSNSCSRAQGGGFYFDELKVYKNDPKFDVEITPVEEVRTNSNTPVRIDIDYSIMMSCMGLTPDDYTKNSTDTRNLDFIIINKDRYDASISGGATTIEALRSSLLDISYVRETSTLSTASAASRVAGSAATTGATTVVTTKNPGVQFYCYYDNNEEYDGDAAGYNFPYTGFLLKRSTKLSADFDVKVSVDSIYMVVVHLSTSSDDSSVNAGSITDEKLETFANLIETQYTDTTKFTAATEISMTRNGYQTTYNGSSITDVSIKHRAARWYQDNIRGQQEFEDSFDDDNPMETIANGVELQSAHIYVDTIYLTKGTSIDIEVPNKFTAYGYLQLSMDNYYRWFNYENDKNFYVGEDFEKKNGSEVNDLLTKYSSNYQAWAFENGYVSGYLNNYTNSNGSNYTLGKITFYYPTDNEFNTYIKSRNLENFEGMDNSYYALACDMSNYTDFYYTDKTTTTYIPCTATTRNLSTFGANDEYYEPTLEIRALFYIVGVDPDSKTMQSGLPDQFQHYWSMLNNSEYQGGTNTGNEKYLEEYEINMPSQRVSQNYNNNEVVALSKEARSYAIPGETGSEVLDVKFASGEDNGLAILSSTRSLSGDVRVIQFYKNSSEYASDDSNSGTYQWSVDDGSTATILVTKTVGGTTYNIARYKLTFKYESIPLTEAQVAALDEKEELGETTWNQMWWNDMTYRSPSYLENNCTLITSLDFDYGGYGNSDLNSMTVFNNAANNTINPHGERFTYPFPLKWNNCSYAFFDGSFDINPIGDAKSTALGNYTFNSGHTAWGAYAIVNYYVGNGELNGYINQWEPLYKKVKNHDGNWLYVDASDLPGTIAELSFENDLCKGAEIMVTAWMRNSNAPSTLNDPAVMFTVMGVEVDGEGNETHVPIYRHYSGMIVNTGGWVYINNEAYLPASVTGKGSGTNEWFQEYFTFKINDDDTHDFAYYTVKIDNCCASTQGGDFYIDEIKVYVKNSEANVEQLEPTCSGSDTPIRVDLDYDGVMAYLQLNTSDYTSSSTDFINADFIIINKYKYDEYIKEHGTDNAAKIAGIKKSIVDVTYVDNGKTITTPDPGMTFYCYYDKNEEYDESTAGSNYPKNDMLLRRSDDLTGYSDLSADFRVNLSTYTPYLLIFHVTDPNTVDNDENGSEISDDKLLIFANYVETQCAIEYEFYVTSNTVIRINGELVDPTLTLCADQAFNIVPTMTYTDLQSGETVEIENEYYDWFIGTEDDYLSIPDGYQVSLYEALKDFRSEYETATEFSASATPVTGDFTQNDYDVIEYWISKGVLLLYRQTYNMIAPEEGITIVLQPIEQSKYSSEACFEYVTLAMLTSGTAPAVNLGFSNVNYPSDAFIPSVRIGLSQIQAAASANKPITVNLRGADYESTIEEEGEDGEEIDISIDHLGLVETENTSDDYTKLYLIWTDDPAYSTYFEPDYDLSQYDLPIGQITRLYANKDATKNDSESGAPTSNGSGIGSYMQIYFYNSDNDGETKFEPKEGCTYTLMVNFEMKDSGGDAVVTSCKGFTLFDMKVVPEYLVWQGDNTGNWNDDANWKRADTDDLGKSSSSDYISNETNTTSNGFVPMLFTSVVMPQDSKAQLYTAGFKASSNVYSWSGEDSNKPTTVSEPMENIMYDMMVYENTSTSALTTERYRVNLCDQIHLGAGAQLLHSELLLYNKAWVDVRVPQSTWSLVSLPLNGVVAGDWYITGQKTSEAGELFSDITFGNSSSRYNPMVYQRSWNSSSSVIVGSSNSGSNNSSSSNNTVPSYSKTGWTSVYNDASVAYGVGEGFSIKAYVEGGSSSGSSLVFRFPKADTRYDYSSSTISRTGAGTLKISDMTDRSSVDGDAGDVNSGNITVSVSETSDGYSLVGNPFTACLSLSQFLSENSSKISSYWLESDYGPTAGTETGNSWGTSETLLPPYGAFFVKANSYSSSGMTLTFTEDMQSLSDATSASKVNAMSIRAANSAGMSSASFAYYDGASDGYSESEDAVMLEDASWNKSGMPMVYTVAGDRAVSVNSLNNLNVIPLGVFADDGCSYTLTFVGVDNVEDPVLYDAEMNTETPITEGFTMTLEGGTHGRYFIRASKSSDGIEEVEVQKVGVSVYSPTSRTIVVSSDAEIETVEVYDINGRMLKRASTSGNACTISDINTGVAIVKVFTNNGTCVSKLRVKN